MTNVKHPFILNLNSVAQDENLVYLFMDYLKNGSVSRLISQKEKLGRQCSEFITAQLVLLIEFLHQNNIMYRDLKSDNILIADNGYIKVTDFGFAKRFKPGDRAYTKCGTDWYMPPEMIENFGIGYTENCDWWSLGIVLYEMMVGETPFHDENPKIVMKKILTQEVTFPEGFDYEAKNLIIRFLRKSPSQRYGATKETMTKLKNHSFFKYTCLKEIINLKAEVPELLKNMEPSSKHTNNIYSHAFLNEKEYAKPLK